MDCPLGICFRGEEAASRMRCFMEGEMTEFRPRDEYSIGG